MALETVSTRPRARRPLRPTAMSLADKLEVGSLGLRTRKGRTVLSAIGIAIGIAALVAVLGLSESSKADLMAQLDKLGTNMLTVSPGSSLMGEETQLPATAPGMIDAIPTVQSSAATYAVKGTVRRTDRIPEIQSSGISIKAADIGLLQEVAANVRAGRWLDAANQELPAVVLGSTTARRLGIVDLQQPIAVWLAEQWYSVVGILDPVTLAPELNDSALIGTSVARQLHVDDLRPTTIYVRADSNQVGPTRDLLPRTANPSAPIEVEVSRPSDALAAQATADKSLTTLSVGLGAVALLVGGVGIANVMVISVLERRREIGVRRALGATRGAIRQQFLIESIALSSLGGLTGALLGVAMTVVFAMGQGWQVVVPSSAILAGIIGFVLIGAIAGSYPAMRAAKIPPTEALQA